MRRALVGLLGALLTVGVWNQAQDPPANQTPTSVPTAPYYQVCPARNDRSTRPVVGLASQSITPLSVSLAAGGELTRFRRRDIGSSGGNVIRPLGSNLVDFGALLLEAETDSYSAAVVSSGTRGRSIHFCHSRSDPLLSSGGWSTLEEDQLFMTLSNPFATEAVVSVTSASEIGLDSATELAEVLVPPFTTLTYDLDQLLPSRAHLAVTLSQVRGSVHALLMESGDGDLAASTPTSPSADWWMLVPSVGQTESVLVLTSVSPEPGEYEIQLFHPEVGSASLEGNLAAREIAVIDLTGYELPVGIRSTSTIPTVLSARLKGEELKAVTGADPFISDRWLLPGAGVDAPAVIWVFNPSTVRVDSILHPLHAQASSQARPIPPGSVVAIPVSSGSGGGYLVETTAEVAVSWTAGADGPTGWGGGVIVDAPLP